MTRAKGKWSKMIKFELIEDIPYLALPGKLRCVCCEYFEDNWSRYNETPMCRLYCSILYYIILSWFLLSWRVHFNELFHCEFKFKYLYCLLYKHCINAILRYDIQKCKSIFVLLQNYMYMYLVHERLHNPHQNISPCVIPHVMPANLQLYSHLLAQSKGKNYCPGRSSY